MVALQLVKTVRARPIRIQTNQLNSQAHTTNKTDRNSNCTFALQKITHRMIWPHLYVALVGIWLSYLKRKRKKNSFSNSICSRFSCSNHPFRCSTIFVCFFVLFFPICCCCASNLKGKLKWMATACSDLTTEHIMWGRETSPKSNLFEHFFKSFNWF